MDLDCGEGKATPDEKTGIPEGYASQEDASIALFNFCELVELPRPALVNSGNGLHAYWGFTEEVQGQRSSKNRPRGIWELKPVNVNRHEYRSMLVDKMLPAIKSKWPNRRSPVVVQQDGAPAHVDESDMNVVLNGNKYGWDINLDKQPPNSPDFNVLDLGLFRAIQSMTWDTDMRDIRDIIKTSQPGPTRDQ